MDSKISEESGPAVDFRVDPDARREDGVDAPTRDRVRTYTVKPGDSLFSIAGDFYGDRRKWRFIYKANCRFIDDPDELAAGQKLAIPCA